MNSLSGYPETHEVFTPGAPPLEEHNVYVNRDAAEAALRKYVQRHQIPVVWGEYGVGKTSLVKRFFQDVRKDGHLVYVASVSGLTLPDIFRVILEHLSYSVELSSVSTNTVGGEGGVDFGIVKATAKGDITKSVHSELVVSSPTDVGMNNLMRDHGLTVVLDEMHKAGDQLRKSLVDWIKATRADPGGFSLVLVGTSTDAGRLVALDQGIDRYVKEMAVDLMTDSEARYIVDEGFSRLGLRIDPRLRERLVRSAAGAPTIVQALCLDAAESAIERGHEREVLETDVRFAVSAYLNENTGRLYDHYFRAIETTGQRRYRKQILRAVAITTTDYATMDDIRAGVSQSLHEDIPAQSLSGPLRDLKKAEFGSILKDVDREVSGQRIHNLTAFADPMMKSFVRFMNNLDQTGLMPPAPEVVDDSGEV